MGTLNSVGFPRAFLLLARTRIENIFFWSWCTAICCLIVGRGFPPLLPTLKSVFAMMFATMAVYFYNDVADRDMDAINPQKRGKPLPSGAVSVGDANRIVALCALLSVLVASTLNVVSFAAVVTYLVLFLAYSYPGIRLKRMFLVNEVTIFVAFPLCGVIASYAISGALSMRALFSGFIFGVFIILAKPAFADTLDLEEDRAYGHKTLGVILSWRRKVQLVVFALLFIMTVTPLTYVQLGFNVVAPILVVAASFLMLGTVYPMRNEYDRVKAVSWRKYGHIYFFVLQIIMILGSMQLGFL